MALEEERIKQEMGRLERELEKHARLYYELDAPVIEDSEYAVSYTHLVEKSLP